MSTELVVGLLVIVCIVQSLLLWHHAYLLQKMKADVRSVRADDANRYADLAGQISRVEDRDRFMNRMILDYFDLMVVETPAIRATSSLRPRYKDKPCTPTPSSPQSPAPAGTADEARAATSDTP